MCQNKYCTLPVMMKQKGHLTINDLEHIILTGQLTCSMLPPNGLQPKLCL